MILQESEIPTMPSMAQTMITVRVFLDMSLNFLSGYSIPYNTQMYHIYHRQLIMFKCENYFINGMFVNGGMTNMTLGWLFHALHPTAAVR